MSVETQIYVSTIVLIMYICFFTLTKLNGGAKKRFFSLYVLLLIYIIHSVFLLLTCVLDAVRPNAVMQYICCTGYSITGFLALFFYGRYYIETCEASKKTLKYLTAFNYTILILNMVTTLPFIPSGRFFSVMPDGTYVRGSLFFFSYLFIAIELTVLAAYAVLALPNRKKAVGYVAFGAFPLIISSLLVFFPIASPMIDFSTVISCLILYSFVFLEDRQKALENETRLAKYKTDIMLSQIGPHFIYNTLSTISALCTVDPQRAQDLSADFTDYLRSNLDKAESQRLSSFTEELNHTKKYLEIEKVRFGKKLNVEYDIRETDFILPSLSLQPIAENAVKHGITRKREGGTVRIATEKREDGFAITVSDDGVGFDAENYVSQEGHYGMRNTEERLRLLLDGEMKVESRAGVGTKVTMVVKGAENR